MCIETDRLLLIPVSEQYADEVFQHFRGEVLTYMAADAPESREATRQLLCGYARRYEQGTEAVYAILLKEERTFIGLAALHDLQEESPELGIWTRPEFHGCHYGREAVGALIARARRLGIQRLRYPVDRRNIASKKIPLYYGGCLTPQSRTVRLPGGRVLEEVTYEIVPAARENGKT